MSDRSTSLQRYTAKSYSIQNPAAKNTLSFNVDDDSEIGLALIAFTSKQVNLQYNATVNGTTKKSSSPRPERCVRYVFATSIVVSVALAFF